LKIHALSGAVLALTTIAAAAAPAPSGFIGFDMGATSTDFDVHHNFYGGDSTAFLFGGHAALNAWLSDDMSVQFDLAGEGTGPIERYLAGADYKDGRTGALAGAHVSWRNPQSYLFGAFAGLSAQSNLDYEGTMSHAVFGVEGQYYCGSLTLYGQAGYIGLLYDAGEYEPKSIWFLRGVARYFVDAADKLQADVSYGDTDEIVLRPKNTSEFWNASASWEHRFDGSPFSLTLAYSGMWAEADNHFDPFRSTAQENIVTLGVSLHLGDGSLKEADRNGATLDLPNFNRAEAWSFWLGYN
jgi:hypothetical protein